MNRLDLKVVTATTTVFVGIVYLLCAVFRPVFPDWPMYRAEAWAAAFPGFAWTVEGVLLGFVEAVLYAALGSALFVGLYNFFAARFAPARA